MSNNNDRKFKHPPHLRGREIGLFYAKRNYEKRMRIMSASNTAEGANCSSSEDNQSPQRNVQVDKAAYREGKRKSEIDRHLNMVLGQIRLSNDDKGQIKKLLDNTSELHGAFNLDSVFHKKFLNVVSGSIHNNVPPCNTMQNVPEIDNTLLKEHLERQETPKYKQMLEHRQKLPSFKMKDEILKLINENPVVLISGETGCGKTTQVAQFILDDYVEKSKGSTCKIICTQPRRISAISIAERVAVERAERFGAAVGYQIRLENRFPRDKGSILFCTTGIILRQMASDPYLSEVSHIIVDEIHERSVESDFILSILKQVMSKRTDLKLILMSATLNAEKFSVYFNSCVHLNIPGFTYPVTEYYLEDVLELTNFQLNIFNVKPAKGAKGRRKWRPRPTDKAYSDFIEPYVRQLENEKKYSRNVCIQLRQPEIEVENNDLILELLINICYKQRIDGAILVFATGYAMISALHKLIKDSGKFPGYAYLIIPLHSQMPTVYQREVFERPPPGVRKIIIATQIAETSITIDDVVFVIDCGKLKLSNYDTGTNTQTLDCEWVSLANAHQRRGRAGRVQAGVCYHLYSRAREMTLEKYQEPEILRTRLENTILDIKILQLGQAETFLSSLLDCPSSEAIELALKCLKRLNALNEDESLTPLGYHLGQLPLQVQISKMILMGSLFSCLDPILSVAASLDFKDAFQCPLDKEKEALKKRRELGQNCKSDHILLHYALKQFEELSDRDSKKFCYEYFLNWHTLKQLKKMKGQLMERLYDMKFVKSKDPYHPNYNVNSENLELVKAIICAGLYPNIGIIRFHRKNYVYTLDRDKCELSMKTLLTKDVGGQIALIIYYLKLRSTSNWICDATLINPLPVVFFGDNFKKLEDKGTLFITIGKQDLKFQCTPGTFQVIQDLRERLNWVLESKINNPGIVDWSTENAETSVLSAIVELITLECSRMYSLDDDDI